MLQSKLANISGLEYLVFKVIKRIYSIIREVPSKASLYKAAATYITYIGYIITTQNLENII